MLNLTTSAKAMLVVLAAGLVVADPAAAQQKVPVKFTLD